MGPSDFSLYKHFNTFLLRSFNQLLKAKTFNPFFLHKYPTFFHFQLFQLLFASQLVFCLFVPSYFFFFPHSVLDSLTLRGCADPQKSQRVCPTKENKQTKKQKKKTATVLPGLFSTGQCMKVRRGGRAEVPESDSGYM